MPRTALTNSSQSLFLRCPSSGLPKSSAHLGSFSLPQSGPKRVQQQLASAQGPGLNTENRRQDLTSRRWRGNSPQQLPSFPMGRVLASLTHVSPPHHCWLLIGCSICLSPQRTVRRLRRAGNAAESWRFGTAGSVRDGECPPEAAVAGCGRPAWPSPGRGSGRWASPHGIRGCGPLVPTEAERPEAGL